MKNFIICLILSVGALSIMTGCETTGSRSSVLTNVWQTDPYTKKMSLVGAIAPKRLLDKTSVRLIASKDEEVLVFAVNATYMGKEWLFLNRAVDSNGKELIIFNRDRDVVSGGFVIETILIALTRSELEGYRASGKMDVKLYGDRGHQIINFSAAYIRDFLASCDVNTATFL